MSGLRDKVSASINRQVDYHLHEATRDGLYYPTSTEVDEIIQLVKEAVKEKAEYHLSELDKCTYSFDGRQRALSARRYFLMSIDEI